MWFASTSAALLLLQQLTNGQTTLDCNVNNAVEQTYGGEVVHLQMVMPTSGDLELDCGASTFADDMVIRVKDSDGADIRDLKRQADVTFHMNLDHATEVNFYISGPEVNDESLSCVMRCTLDPTASPTPGPTASPIVDVDCPMATTEVSKTMVPATSMGTATTNPTTIEDCRNACDARTGCRSFSWNPADLKCTLYDSDTPTSLATGQVTCAVEGAPQCAVQCSGADATLSGDPHSTLWNGAYHHFQGETSADDYSPQQFYFMTPCDHDDRHYQPYSILGKFQRWTYNADLAGLDYVTLMLYDEYDTYYVWFSTGIRRWVKASAAVSTLYDENLANGVAMTQITAGDTYVANGKFKVNTNNNEGDQSAWLHLTHVPTGCTQSIYMQWQSSWNSDGIQRWGMHYAKFTVPSCYKCTTCGMLGDFQHSCHNYRVTGCDGQDHDMSSAHNWVPPAGAAWEEIGWTWQKDYVDSDACSPRMQGFLDGNQAVSAKAPKGKGKTALGGKNAKGGKEPKRGKGPKAGAKGKKGKNQAPQQGPQCDSDVEATVIAKCQAARDSLATCCRNIGGVFCDEEQNDAVIDVCIAATANFDELDERIASEFTAVIEEECTNKGGFGQVPVFLYEFDGDLTETMFDGEAHLTLSTNGGAFVDDGALECSADGDYVFTNLDLSAYAGHGYSVEVLVEVGNSGTLEHLVAVVRGGDGGEQIYRNAEQDATYDPHDFLAVDAEGITFCGRHVAGSDVEDKIFIGAVYDYALAAEDVDELYREKVVEFDDDGLVTIEAIGSELKPGQSLLAGQGLLSVDQRYLAALMWSGQFVIYDTVNEEMVFETGQSSGTKMTFQTDGNLLIQNGFARSVWHAGEVDDAPSMLLMGTNGVLAAYNEAGDIYWNSADHVYSRPAAKISGVGLLEPDTVAKDASSGWTVTLHASTETFLLYFCAVLVLANVICGTLYCYSQRSQNVYKVVSMEMTGAEDTESELE